MIHKSTSRVSFQYGWPGALALCLGASSAGCLEASLEDPAEEDEIGVEHDELVPGQVDPIRVQAILAAYDDGSGAPSVTATDIRSALTLATSIFASASIRFNFDPQTDILRINSSLLARDCTLAPGTVLPSRIEPSCNFDLNNNERNRVAQGYPGKLVLYFSNGDRPRKDAAGIWTYAPKDFHWSNGTDWFAVMMPVNPGDGLAHEIKHYLHLDHPFGPLHTSLVAASEDVRTFVESNGLPRSLGAERFNGDGLVSTPPDPGPELFAAAGLDPCNINHHTLSLRVTFSDNSQTTYSLRPDRENIMNYWNKTCRGGQPRISADQVTRVRNAIDVANRKHLTDYRQQYTAVFEPGNTGQTRAIGWAFTDMVTRFDQEIAAGRHLVHMQAYDIGGGQIRYDGVWESGARGTTRAFGWALNDFATRFNQEIAAGRHLVHMQAYDIGGRQIRYDGVWESGARVTSRAIAWALYDFSTRFDQEVAAGKHLVHMQAYDIGGGQIRYDGVWEGGARETSRANAWSLLDFATRFDQEIAGGRHLVHMQAYDIGGGQIRYDGVWENGSSGNAAVLAWAFNDFVLRDEQQRAAGKRLVHMQQYDIGNGQIRYDGVWETSTIVQTHVFAETIYKFAENFNAQLAAGRHASIMHSVRGR